MEKAKLNYIIDIFLGISFLIMSITGIAKWPGISATIGFSPRAIIPEINTLHDFSGLILTLLVLIHLILHWNWIVCMTKSFFKKEKKCD